MDAFRICAEQLVSYMFFFVQNVLLSKAYARLTYCRQKKNIHWNFWFVFEIIFEF